MDDSTPGAPVALSVATPAATVPVTVSVPAPAAPAAPPAPAPDSFPISLEEFCLRHSKVERGIELLSAFHAHEARTGAGHATEAAFAARLAAFAARPVG